MAIPETRDELTRQITSSFTKLREELDQAGPHVATLPCVDDWSVKDLLAVRAWWAEHVIDWVQAGQRGETPVTPAPGYRWRETPQLNDHTVAHYRETPYQTVRTHLQRAHERVIDTIHALDDTELLVVGVFPWAGKQPISRWISINTTRQYQTARTYIRRAVKAN